MESEAFGKDTNQANVPPQPGEAPQLESKPKFTKKITLGIILSLLILASLVFVLVKGVSKNNEPSKPVNEKNIEIKSDKNIQVLDNSVVLLPSISNFDNLKIEDLPNFQDVRSVYSYKENIIITGVEQVVEYNLKTNEYVRLLRSDAIKTLVSGVVVGDHLYVTNDRPYAKLEDFPPQREMNKIDLKTGKVVKTYFRNDSRRLANLNAVEKDGIIWMYSWDGAIRFDPIKDEFKDYPGNRLGGLCNAHGIYKKDNQIKLAFLCNGTEKASIYNEETDTWNIQDFDDTEWSNAINKGPKDFNLNLPYFSLLSNKVNGKYYAFSDKGVYTIRKNETPKFYKNFQFGLYDNATLYITRDEKLAFIIGQSFCGPETQCPPPVVVMVDLANGSSRNLLEDNSTFQTMTLKEKQSFGSLLTSGITVSETGAKIVVKTKKEEKPLLEIDTLTKTLKLYE
jgi:hypothetical protein